MNFISISGVSQSYPSPEPTETLNEIILKANQEEIGIYSWARSTTTSLFVLVKVSDGNVFQFCCIYILHTHIYNLVKEY